MLRAALNKSSQQLPKEKKKQFYGYYYILGAFNKFPDFFVQAFTIVVDSWKFIMLLLYI